ncbi:MAG: hypothetical protein ACJ75J_14210 [Cytophagaceae bacterium]
MNRFVDYIARPRLTILTIFAIVSFINIAAYVWWFSFVWEFVFGVKHYIIVLLILIIIGLSISIIIDKKFNSRLKKYLIVALVELLFIWSIANPIRTWQINASFTRAKDINESLKKFKTQFGTYPTSLTVLEEKLELDLPKWTYLGTVYEYEQDGNNNYWLRFRSYYGYTASYNKDVDDWILVD